MFIFNLSSAQEVASKNLVNLGNWSKASEVMELNELLASELQGARLNDEAKVVEQIFDDGSKKLRIEVTTDAGGRYRLPVSAVKCSINKDDTVKTSDLGGIVLYKAGQSPIVRYGLKSDLKAE